MSEGVLVILLGLYFKVKGVSAGGSSGEVNAWDLLEAQVNQRLVHIDEEDTAALKSSYTHTLYTENLSDFTHTDKWAQLLILTYYYKHEN